MSFTPFSFPLLEPTVTWEEFLSILRFFLSLLFRKAKIPKNSRNVNGSLKSRYLCFRHLIREWLVVMILFAHLSLSLCHAISSRDRVNPHNYLLSLFRNVKPEEDDFLKKHSHTIYYSGKLYLSLSPKIHLQSPVSPTSCQLPEKWHCQREVGISGGTSLRA